MRRLPLAPIVVAAAFLAGLFSPWRPTLGGADARPAAQPAGRYFPETQHWVRGSFLQYWNDHGGLTQQGFPLSEDLPLIAEEFLPADKGTAAGAVERGGCGVKHRCLLWLLGCQPAQGSCPKGHGAGNYPGALAGVVSNGEVARRPRRARGAVSGRGP